MRCVTPANCSNRSGSPEMDHQAAGHGDETLQHCAVGKHSPFRVPFHHLGDDPRVENLVTRLVAGDLATNPGKVFIALGGGEPANVPVGHPGLRVPGTPRK